MIRLEEFYRNNIISEPELEFARFLNAMDEHAGEDVLLAAAACLNAQLNGHICLDFSRFDGRYLFQNKKSGIKLDANTREKWMQALKQSNLLAKSGMLNPLVLEGERLYLHRFWSYEEELANWIKHKVSKTFSLSTQDIGILEEIIRPENGGVNWQHVAVVLSFLKKLLFITGGPGTGKTFTVLNIIAALNKREGGELNIALAAPTGKAARRLSEALQAGKESMSGEMRRYVPEAEALTVHKLLGSDFLGLNFAYHEKNKLSYDLIVVDEASMLDINLWINLIRAIPEQARLIILGDKNQLSSVEAGSILGDICRGGNTFSTHIGTQVEQIVGGKIPVENSLPAVNDSIVFLTKSYRFAQHSGIYALAQAINASDENKVIELLRSDQYPELRWLKPPAGISSIIQEYAVAHYLEYSRAGKGERLAVANKRKILCALRVGKTGAEHINERSEAGIRKILPGHNAEQWYPNRIIMATQNDNVLKIRNGEIGICDTWQNPKVFFEGDEGVPVSVGRLKAYEPAYAISIHKSQGSEFDDVAIILPDQFNPILSKEILYTAVTRARRSTLVYGSEEIIRSTVSGSIARNSGLYEKIWA